LGLPPFPKAPRDSTGLPEASRQRLATLAGNTKPVDTARDA